MSDFLGMRETLIERWNALSERKRDGACLFLLVGICILLFYKTVFLAQPVSRVFNLVNHDVLFHGAVAAKSVSYDLASFWMKVASYMLVSSLWHEGVVPLWNPYGGCGSPLLGEVQAIVLAPWMVFYAIWPGLQTHNYLFVAQQMLGTVGVFLAARALGLSRYASIFAALAHLFCPHQMWRQELQMNWYFYPLAVWCFIRLAQTRYFLWAFGAGAASAAIIVSGDAQVSLLAIGVASLLFVLLNVFDRAGSIYLRFRDAAVWLAMAGVNTFCLCSPVFLSFVEYVRSGDLSKNYAYYAVGAPAPWESLLVAMVHPGYGGASLFIGCLCLPLVCLSFFALKRRPFYLSVLLTTIIAFMSASRTGFFPLFDQVLGLMGLSRFEGMEPFMLQMCFLAAFGLEELVLRISPAQRRRFITFAVACLTAAAAPLLLNQKVLDLNKFTFDPYAGVCSFDKNLWFTDLAFLALMLLIIVCRPLLKTQAILVVTLSAIAFNCASQLRPLKEALPVQPNFKYEMFEPLKFLKEHNDRRVVAVGYNFLHPNTNYVYRIKNLANHGPLEPLRLRPFIRACGGTADGFNGIFPKATLTKAINLASVGYVLSLVPVRQAGEKYSQEKKFDWPEITFKNADGLKLVGGVISYDAAKQEFGGHIDWRLLPATGEKYCYRIVVLDAAGNPGWTAGPYYVREREYVKEDKRPEDFSRVPVEGPVVSALPDGANFSVAIYAQTVADFQALEPSLKFKNDKYSIVLGTFKKQTVELPEDRQFKPIMEIPGLNARLYENRQAMPMAYLVHETVHAGSEGEALAKVLASSFDPHRQVVIEDKAVMLEKSEGNGVAKDEVKASGQDVNTVVVDVKTGSKGLLVVTDQYYPGWHAVVDGVEKPIVRANYLFKAVPLEAGAHKIVLYFRPTYLVPGLVLFACCILLNAGMLLFSSGRRLKEVIAPELS